MSPRVSIVIVNWKTPELLAGCLDSILADPAAAEFEIWVVDNASGDDSLAVLLTRAVLPKVVRCDQSDARRRQREQRQYRQTPPFQVHRQLPGAERCKHVGGGSERGDHCPREAGDDASGIVGSDHAQQEAQVAAYHRT